MKNKQLTPALPTEAEVAARSISGLTLDNLEDRVEHLRHASEPTRKARAATNRASRLEQQRKLAADKNKS